MVLFVDDELGVLSSLRRLFAREPYLVSLVSSGKEALKLLATLEEVAVIISDQRMPEMGGTEFLTLSRELAPDAVRMLITGYSDFQATIDAMNSGGATRYISKPWDDNELLQSVRDAVEEYARKKAAKAELSLLQERLELQRQNQEEKLRLQTAELERQLLEAQQDVQHQQGSYRMLIGALAGLIDLRVPTSRRHAANTSFLAVAVATALDLPPHETEDIQMAALLHDIGKNALSDDVLDAPPESMTETQLSLYRAHSVIGQSMIETVADLKPIGRLVRHHHECFDGSGFPDGLAGSAIPLGAAIVCLANAVDTEMGFQAGLAAIEKVLVKLAGRVGTEFDPELFQYISAPALKLYGN
ncbi:MAG: response regulator [Deltaproteobacteria bacterium]|nr:response regulator [Deltaproteobacteria bacterium]